MVARVHNSVDNTLYKGHGTFNLCTKDKFSDPTVDNTSYKGHSTFNLCTKDKFCDPTVDNTSYKGHGTFNLCTKDKFCDPTGLLQCILSLKGYITSVLQ